MKNFSTLHRNEYILAQQEITFDLVIIGGGITGAGVARDAASRGMKVALVEAQDFAEGTSSRSSKLIHGGIRYLENFEFHLVYEALSERNKLFSMAPHLVHPLRFMIPTYKGGRVPHWKFRIGMWLYDLLALFQAPEMHDHYNKKEALEEFGFLKEEGLQGGFLYSDAYTDDDRLTIETIRSAHDLGANCVNFVKAEGFERKNGFIELSCKNKLSNSLYKIKAQHIVSAVGPWTDLLGGSFFDNWKNKMRPSKGIHLTFSRERIPLEHAVVMGAEDRIVFAIPRHEMVIIGTTDTDYKDSPSDVKSTKEDVDYVLGVINDYFPGLKIGLKDIYSSYSGVRPLIDDGSSSEGKTSREHVVFQPIPEMTCVAGGKYTTYRKMARDVVDTSLGAFAFEKRMQFDPPRTDIPLNPMATQESFIKCNLMKELWAAEYKLPENLIKKFIDRYALECEDILKISLKYQNLSGPHRFWASEAEFAIENTMCVNLIDFYLRRTPLFLSHKDHGFEFLSTILLVFKKNLNWDEAELKAQKNALHQHIHHEMGWMK